TRRLFRIDHRQAVAGDHHERPVSALRRITSDSNSARKCHAQQTVLHFILCDEPAGKLFQLVRRKRNLQIEKLRAARQPLEVLRPAKQFAAPHAYCLKQAIAIEKTPVEDGNDRLIFGYELAIEEYDHASSPSVLNATQE